MFREEVLTESPAVYTEDYETERNKPMPNRIHGLTQQEIGFQVKLKYGNKFNIESEVALDTEPAATPDILIFEPKILDLREVTAKSSEMPITTIEILSPSQSLTELQNKAWDIYFPKGVQSAWIVVPELKAIQVLYPDRTKQTFVEGNLHDRVTGIEIPIEKVFQNIK